MCSYIRTCPHPHPHADTTAGQPWPMRRLCRRPSGVRAPRRQARREEAPTLRWPRRYAPCGLPAASSDRRRQASLRAFVPVIGFVRVCCVLRMRACVPQAAPTLQPEDDVATNIRPEPDATIAHSRASEAKPTAMTEEPPPQLPTSELTNGEAVAAAVAAAKASLAQYEMRASASTAAAVGSDRTDGAVREQPMPLVSELGGFEPDPSERQTIDKMVRRFVSAASRAPRCLGWPIWHDDVAWVDCCRCL
jgi:hypothetical protein